MAIDQVAFFDAHIEVYTDDSRVKIQYDTYVHFLLPLLRPRLLSCSPSPHSPRLTLLSRLHRIPCPAPPFRRSSVPFPFPFPVPRDLPSMIYPAPSHLIVVHIRNLRLHLLPCYALLDSLSSTHGCP